MKNKKEGVILDLEPMQPVHYDIPEESKVFNLPTTDSEFRIYTIISYIIFISAILVIGYVIYNTL